MPRKKLLSRHDLPAAFGLLSRLPVPVHGEAAQRRGAAAAWAFPLVGALLAGIAGTLHTTAMLAGLPGTLSAILAVSALVLLTGALHEDGLADMADGVWGGWTRERRLEIMKDSRIGSYGVLVLILSVALRIGALASLPPLQVGWALVAASVLSRTAMVLLWGTLRPARRTGLSAHAGRPRAATCRLAAVIGIGLCAALLPLGTAALCTIAAILAVGSVGLIAWRKIGGQTGDVLGAAQQVAEIAVLLTLVALAA